MAWGKGRWRAKEGQSLVIVALLLPLMIGAAGAGVTVGTVYYSQAQLQSAVDAAALAGAKALVSGDTSAPQDQSSLLTADDPAAVNVSVTVSPTNPSEVIASATTYAPGTFASLFGHHTFTINARAAALASPGAPFTYAVFQGDPNSANPPLSLSGNPTILSANGLPSANVHSNNNLDLSGSVSVAGSCQGDPTVTVGGSSSCQGGIVQPAPQLSMPQWTRSQVTPTNAVTVGSASDPVGMTIGSGQTQTGNYIVYGNLTINGNATVTGNYLVEGGNIIVTGNASIAGSLVTFGGGIYISGNVTQSPGDMLSLAAFTANGQLASNATSPGTYSPPTPGAIEIDGNVTVDSVLYAPDSFVDLYGNVTVQGNVIGYTVALNGNVNVVKPDTTSQAVPVQQVTLVQ